MKKLLIILSVLLTTIPYIAFADTNTTANVGFYIADEDKGVQYIEDSETPYIKNFELMKIQITENHGDITKSYYFDESDGMEIPFEFNKKSTYITTIIYAP